MYRATYRQAESELLGAAEFLNRDTANGRRLSELQIPLSYFDRFGKAERDHAFWIAWDERGKTLAVSEPPPPETGMLVDPGPHPKAKPFRTVRFGTILLLYLEGESNVRWMVGRPLSKEYDALWRTAYWIVGFGLVGSALAAILAAWLTSWLATPLRHFAEQVDRIDDRQFSVTLDEDLRTTELTQLARAFNLMLDRLRSAFEREKQFTSDAAHELRTPLSILLAQAEFALSREREPIEYRDGFVTCRETALHMKQIISRLLDLSNHDKRSPVADFSDIDFAALAASCVASTRRLAEKRRIEFDLHSNPAYVFGDATAVKEIVLNILANAIQYNVDGGKVEVFIETDQDTVLFRVVDTGIGISEDDLPRVCDRFFRADQARTTMDGGSGLGLSLVKELLVLHGGSLKIHSRLNEGTTVEVTLPVVKRLG